MESLYIINACYICIIICLLIVLFLYRKKIRALRIKEALNEQAALLTNKHFEEKKQDMQHTLMLNKNEYLTQLELIKKEYALNLANALQEQEKTLQLQYAQKQELMQEILQTNQEKHSALMTQRFYEISEKLLEEKNRQFQEKQTDSLKPLCDEIMRFKTEITQHTKENHERNIALNAEIKHLREASLQISADANNLANAMRGDSKLQGQWGEVILERLLETSGLQKGREYYTQVHVKNEAKEILRPDVVIQLPNNRFVVVDSKVSLKAYEQFFNAKDSKETHLQAHLESVKNHIKSLSIKQYQHYIEGGQLDFVIMFMPLEGAYSAVLQHNMQLFLDSYNKGIILAAPTTLMVILRLIHHIWTNEAKDKNITKILQECVKLIKKFDGFTESMEKINRALETAQNAYEKAEIQVKGRGSLGSYIRNLDTYMSQITIDTKSQMHTTNNKGLEAEKDDNILNISQHEQIAL
ncbi:hypothetical protein NHP164001_09060 [Helicobacter trogontum]|uniref:DNA recombination protein RmuC n=1 Tax=Helicobacter trogontum TaxID=50960 RepID=A0ABQ0D3J3_9HELI